MFAYTNWLLLIWVVIWSVIGGVGLFLLVKQLYDYVRARRRISRAGMDGAAELLRDGSAVLRAQAARTLGRSGDIQAIGPLTEALVDKNARVRLNAVKALGRLRHGPIQDALVYALADPNEDVACKAAKLLGKIGNVRAYVSLFELARAVVGRATGALGGDALAAMLKIESRLLRCPLTDNGMRVVRDGGPDKLFEAGQSVVQTLADALADKTRWVRAYAVRGLTLIGGDEACHWLRKVFASDESKDVRALSAFGLVRRAHDGQAFRFLLERVRPRDVLWDLPRIFASANGPPLSLATDALQHPNARVRWVTAKLLGKIGDEAAVPHLTRLLQDSDRVVRTQARSALRSTARHAEKKQLATGRRPGRGAE